MCAEFIPDGDLLDRSIYFPFMEENGGLDVLNVFNFSSEGGNKVSVIWRKYCDCMCVNQIGCEKQKRDILEKTDPNHHKYNRNFDAKTYKYKGSIEGKVLNVRNIKGDKTTMTVVHSPEDGQGIHHAEIRLEFVSGMALTKHQRKTEVRLVKLLLYKQFSAIKPHVCNA